MRRGWILGIGVRGLLLWTTVILVAGSVGAQETPRRLPPVTDEVPVSSTTSPAPEIVPPANARVGTPTGSGQPSSHDDPDSDVELPDEELPPGRLWYIPSFWPASASWERSFQVGISGSSGNAETLSLQLGTDWKRKLESSELDISVVYNKAENAGVETKNNGLLNVDYQRLFAESRWAVFLKNAVEYDKFKAFDLRWAINAGATYHLLQDEGLKLDLRFGSGTSTEFGGPDNRWVPEAVFGGDYEHQWTPQQKFKLTWDYFPDWSDFGNYRIVSKASWELMLDKPRNLSFKISLIERYDSTPHDRRPSDLDYAYVLMWKR